MTGLTRTGETEPKSRTAKENECSAITYPSLGSGDETRGVLREARIRIGAEPPGGSRRAAILQGRRHGDAGSSGGGARSLGLVRIGDFGYPVRHWARIGEEEGRGWSKDRCRACVRDSERDCVLWVSL